MGAHLTVQKRAKSSPDKRRQAVGGVKGQDAHVRESPEVFKREPDAKRDVLFGKKQPQTLHRPARSRLYLHPKIKSKTCVIIPKLASIKPKILPKCKAILACRAATPHIEIKRIGTNPK